jgi:hypothetical protein
MIEYASLGKLSDIIPDIPGAQLFLDAAEDLDLSVLEQVHIQDFIISEDSLGRPFIRIAAAITGETTLPIPAPDFISLQLGATIPGFTFVRAYLLLGQHGYLQIYDFRLALRIEQPFLRLYDLEKEQILADEFRFELDAALTIDQVLDFQFEFYNFNIPPFTIGNTGLIMGLEGCRIDMGGQSDSTGVATIVGNREFKGIYAKSAILYWLPQFRIPFAPFKGVRLEFENVVLEKEGISFDFDLTWHVAHENGRFLPETEFLGTLFGDLISVALAQATGRVTENIPRSLALNGFIEIPFLQTILAVTFTLDPDFESESFTTTITLSKDSTQDIIIPLGSAAYQLSIQSLMFSGELSDEGFHLEGLGGFAINLPGFVISLSETRIRYTHGKGEDNFAITLENLQFGPFGTVKEATLRLNASRSEDGTTELSDLFMEMVIAWQDLRRRLNLDQLPEQFPLPPDNAEITAYLNWENDGSGNYKLVLRFAAELSGLGSIWSFIPEDFQPEVQNVRFMFQATYANVTEFQNASTSDAFNGDVSVEMELRLPEFLTVPGADLFDFDREQWIKAALKGGVRSVNGANEGYMEMGIANAPKIGVNFPGIPQVEPPIRIELKKADFNLKAQQGSDALTGQLFIEGGFDFRPINPAESNLPVPPVMAAHMEKLFKAAGLEKKFGGTAKFDLKFKGNKMSMELGITFEHAQIELDLFDMMAGLSRGLAPPQGMDGSANSIDLDIDVDIKLREIKLNFGSIEETAEVDQSRFGFELGLDATIAGVQVDNFSFKLSNQEFSFGFGELAVPIALPRFPISLNDLNQLRVNAGAWDYRNKWRQGVRPQLVSSISELKDEIEALKIELEEISGNAEPSLKNELRAKRKKLFENSARQFLIDSIFAVHQMVGESNQGVYQTMVEAYMAFMDATVHQIAFDTNLDFVLSDVRFVLPFQNPSDIRVEGGAQLRGFKDDDPLKPLEDLKFKLGLSAEYIYFSVEGGDPISLPVFGEYENKAGDMEAKVSLRLNHARIGYGYSKNALVVAFAGELNIAKPLADDLNTANAIGIGVRLPERSRLGFKLDLIPISLGEVNFLLPLLEFDIDLRKEYSPGIIDSATCEPYWDGLQLIAPDIIRKDFKQLRFSPFFGSLLAPNFKLSFDLMLGNAQNGLTYVCDDLLIILPTSPQTIIPMLADGVPFFNNLCANIRIAGFGVNFNLQRPFPSMSPLALFEIFGLLADPMMPVDPNGALANTIRATIQHARITMPPSVVRMFPEYGAVLSREINYTINLGTVITVMQAIAGPVGQILERFQQATGNVADLLDEIKTNPPQVNPSKVLELLPPELRRIDLEGSFVGFNASAAFVLLTPDEASEAFKRRDLPVPGVSTTAPRYGEYPDSAWMTTYQPRFSGPTAPFYNPNEPSNSLLSQAPFDQFDEASLAELRTPVTEASGVLLGAEVTVLEDQAFRFLGYLFTDGSFGLISTLDIKKLDLSVAGFQIKLPLEVQGRLALDGRAQGAMSYAKVTASVWGTWEPLPGIIELYAGSKGNPIKLMLQSNAHFALKGSGRLKLFRGAAVIDGTVDISHTHCFVSGSFSYKPNFKIGTEQILVLSLTSDGRVGPANSFELSGMGDLKILGKEVSNVKGLISDKGVALETQFDTTDWNWGGIDIKRFTMALRGMIDLSRSGPPEFLFEGDTYLRLFGSSTSANRLEIKGRGGIRAERGHLAGFTEGKLFWQGREWLQGRILLHSRTGIELEGQTHFGLTLSPGNIGGVNVAGLFFRINLGGTVNISPTGSFSCDLRLDWDLGINLPGNKNQTLPIASNSIRLTGNMNSPIELINLNGFKLLPLQGLEISLPIPQIKGKGNPIVKIGSKNNKVAINLPQLGTIYIDEKEFATGLSGGSFPSLSGGALPSLSPGTLPSLNPGTLPSLNPGTLPNLNRGTLPSLSINFLSGIFNFNRGSLPSLTSGTLPSLTPGKLPSLTPGTLPSLNAGSFPKLSGGSFPLLTKSTIPVPSYSSGEQFDSGSNPALIYKDYEVKWENEVIPINLSTLSSSQISFGIENQTRRFYLQIGNRKYAFNGDQL